MGTLVEETEKVDMEMAEKMKKKKKETNSSSVIPGQSDIALSKHSRKLKAIHAAYEKKYSPPSSVSPSVDPPKTQSSQVTEDESTSAISTEDESDFNDLFDDLFSSESTAAPVVPYHGKTPSGPLSGTESTSPRSSTSPSSESVACNMPKIFPSKYPQWPSNDPWSGYGLSASYPLQTKHSAPLCSVSPFTPIKSEPSMYDLLSFNPQKKPRAPLRESDSPASSVSMRSDSSMNTPVSFNLQKKQRALFDDTDSIISSVSMRSASSMYEPPSFNLQKKRGQLTEEISSCSVCLKAVKDPVRLLCGHWSCKQCVLSHWDQYGSTADYSCKKCGKRFRGEPEHQTDSEDDKKNLKLPVASRPAAQNTTGPAGREKRDQDLCSVLLEKEIKRVEMETRKFQAEKEKFELEKRKLALEIQLLEQKSSFAN